MIEGGGSSEAWYGAKNLRCRGSDTFSRPGKIMAPWYTWRAPARWRMIRVLLSRQESQPTGGKITLRRDLIERGGSSEAWYGGEGGNSKSRKRHLFTAVELYGPLVQLARPCLLADNRVASVAPSMAERVGFEPTVPVRGQRFSRPPDSAALAPLRKSLPIVITDYTGRHLRYRGNGFRDRTIEPLSHLSGSHSQS